MSVTSAAFEFAAISLLRRTPGLAQNGNERKFRSLFGTSSSTCAIFWSMLESQLFPSAEPKHLLWSLLFLKVYATEDVNALITSVDVKTFRFWSWTFVELLSNLDVIDWDSIHRSKRYGDCRASVDGTDFRIFEPSPFDPKWFSHKFKGLGLRYEIGICIESGAIIWSHGPFPCGAFPDVKFFGLSLKQALDGNERIVADGGYKDPKFRYPGNNSGFERFDAIVRARHETVNRRFKQFHVLSHRFRHRLDLHSRCFHAVCNIVQVSLRNEESLFNVEFVE